tara:strand:- start:2102 stop:5311 length:3210 start_codon:yes stop_codon:yes gene_type:complete
MAKQLLEINKFQSGTVTTPDATDTPEQSATFSINLDCVNKDGALQGAPINAAITIRNSDTSADATPDIDKAKVIRSLADDGTIKEDVLYFEAANNKLNFISNLEKANTTTRLNHSANSSIFPSSGKEFNTVALKDVAMENHNKEVHVGLGQFNNPQWIGYTNHKGLVNEAKILVSEDAEVKYPSSVPYIHKMVLGSTGDSYFYGIQIGGTRIWKIDGSADATYGGTKVAASTKDTFTNLQSIASDPANGRLYVLDKQGDGYVYEVSIDDLDEKDVTYTLPSTFPGPGASWYSDIQYTSGGSGKIWLAAHYDSRTGAAAHATPFIWNFAYNASSSSPTLVSKMPRTSGGNNTTPGTWIDVVNETSVGAVAADEMAATEVYIAETFPISLLKHPSDNDAVYWLARYPNTESDGVTTWNNRWLNRTSGDISGSGALANIDSVTCIRTLCLHRIKHDHTAGTDFVPLYNVYHPNDADQNSNSFSAVNIDSIGIDNDGDEVYFTIADKLEKLSTNIVTSWVASETSGNYNKYNLVSANATTPTTSTTYSVSPSGQSPRLGVSINFGYIPSTASAGASNYVAANDNLVVARQTSTAGFDKIAQTFTTGTVQTFFRDHSVLGITAADHASDTGELQSGYTYFYKTTMIYDGYQETPLSMEKTLDVKTDTTNTTVEVKINDYTQIPKRASGVKVYRAESDSNTATSPYSVYRLVKVIPFSKSWTVSGVTYTYTFDDDGIKGASFEAESGLAETLEGTLPRYALSTQLNNQHYIGKCWHDGYVKDATSYIFVSKVGKFDVFDWLVDFIKLPTVPTALTSFAGRVYAFDELNTYRMRGSAGGQGLYIEDVFEGVGCLNDDAVVSTDFGMFFADNKNIYMHNGKSAEPIGEAIVRGDSTYSWQNRDTSYHTRAMYDATRRSVYFTFKAGNNYYAWAWNIPRKRWDMLSFGDTEGTLQPKGYYLLNDTSMNVGTGSAVVKFLGGATKRLWSWVSKDLTMGNDTQQKSIKKLLLPTRIKANYSINSSKPSAGNQVSNTQTRGTYRLAINQKATNLKVRLDSNAAGDECGAVGVLFRTKRSPR